MNGGAVARLRDDRLGRWRVDAGCTQGIGVDPFEREDVGRLEDHLRGVPGLVGLLPTRGAEAPAVSRQETGEPGARRRQVVAGLSRELEELGGHHGAHGVDAHVVGTGVAAAVPVEAGERIVAAVDQFATEHVHGHQFTSDFVMHPVLPIPLDLQELAPVEHVPTETPDVRRVSKKCPTNLKSEGRR